MGEGWSGTVRLFLDSRVAGQAARGTMIWALLALSAVPGGAQEPSPDSLEQETRKMAAADLAGPAYTWRDGDRELRVWLQRDLAVREDGAIRQRENVVTPLGDGLAVVRVEARLEGRDLPVFRSDSGTLMTLPGGVLIIFDEAWGEDRIAEFFAARRIPPERVTRAANAPFLHIVDTEPGFPALELANQLAGEPGVEVSSPNWLRESFPE